MPILEGREISLSGVSPDITCPLQTGQVDDFTWGVVSWDSHLEGAARVAEILGGEDGALLTDQQGSLGVVSV